MANNWLDRFREWWTADPAPPPPKRAPLAVGLEGYERALNELGEAPETLLPALLARDQVESALGTSERLGAEQALRLVQLDAHLRESAQEPSMGELSAWRRALHPPDDRWWWSLDQKLEERKKEGEKERDLLPVLLGGTFLVLTVPLALEIVKRLLVGAPDNVSITGTLITATLTASPLSKRGRELVGSFLRRIPRLPARFHAEAMAGTAGVAFALVLILWFSLPALARYYNNQGHTTLRAGNLTSARRAFQRAVALNPDLVVPYQNLADVYQRIGRPDDAETYYQKAIDQDLDFAPAYQGLGHLYNQGGDFSAAEGVLLAGLDCDYRPDDPALETVTRYQSLSELGWAYFGQERLDRAQAALEAAVALEEEIKALEEREAAQYRYALPHTFLAQVYEALDRSALALAQWEASLRLLDPEDWGDQDYIATALSHMEGLKGDGP